MAKELPADEPDAKKKLAKYYEALREEIFRVQVTKDRIRPDHRAFDEIRAISIETGVSSAHPWFGAVYPRRDAGAGDHDARHQ